MKSTTLTALSLLTILTTAENVQTAHLKFRGIDGHTTYDLAIQANGHPVKTNNDTIINLIDAPDYAAYTLCDFHFAGPTELSTTIASDGVTQQITLTPAVAVRDVKCEGKCIGTYGACYDSNNQPLGICCNGFCAATRCRPWNTGSQ